MEYNIADTDVISNNQVERVSLVTRELKFHRLTSARSLYIGYYYEIIRVYFELQQLPNFPKIGQSFKSLNLSLPGVKI